MMQRAGSREWTWRRVRRWQVQGALVAVGGLVAVIALVPVAASSAAAVPLAVRSRAEAPAPSSPASSARAVVDALAVRSPTQRSGDVVPLDGAVTIFAYDDISILKGSTGVVTVPLDAAKSRALLAVLNELPRRPTGHCMENALVYKLTVRVPGQRTTADVDGWGCDATVSLTVGVSPRPALGDVSCALLHTVIADLPPHEADGTRDAAVGCR